jgi:hypothetical protein
MKIWTGCHIHFLRSLPNNSNVPITAGGFFFSVKVNGHGEMLRSYYFMVKPIPISTQYDVFINCRINDHNTKLWFIVTFIYEKIHQITQGNVFSKK